MTAPEVAGAGGMSHTEREILSQPGVWATTLDTLDPAAGADLLRGADEVVVIGCGSTHYLAMSAAALLRDAGVRAWPLPASELLPGAQRQLREPSRTTVLAISRSGTTTETTRAVEHCRRLGVANVVTVTCDPHSTLALQGDVVLAAPEAQEKSVAQTRSFSTMTVMVSALVGALRGDDVGALRPLAEAAAEALDSSRERMRSLAHSSALDAFYFLGSGPLFGIASEGMLKLKEMSLTTSEAYHGMEFRHGPMSMCGENTGVISLVTPERHQLEDAVTRDLAALGAVLTTVGPGYDVPLASVEPWQRPALYLLPLQLLALERALAKGLDPDQPRHLTAVIHLEEQ